jgi:hypothetical protein
MLRSDGIGDRLQCLSFECLERVADTAWNFN